MRLDLVCLLSAAAFLPGCSSKEKPVAALEIGALPIMERVALGANRCWFKSKDAAFAPYRLAPELKSFTGTPRILVVKRNAPESLPLLVVQAQGNPAKLSAFGPLMQDATISVRVNKDVSHWARGGRDC
ncbi:MAG: hypothetical protein KL863_06745 [Rhizobium sp.]|nr:hypothetical protein [Rhizobium sp.]